jgi:hypothetical protein
MLKPDRSSLQIFVSPTDNGLASIIFVFCVFLAGIDTISSIRKVIPGICWKVSPLKYLWLDYVKALQREILNGQHCDCFSNI